MSTRVPPTIARSPGASRRIVPIFRRHFDRAFQQNNLQRPGFITAHIENGPRHPHRARVRFHAERSRRILHNREKRLTVFQRDLPLGPSHAHTQDRPRIQLRLRSIRKSHALPLRARCLIIVRPLDKPPRRQHDQRSNRSRPRPNREKSNATPFARTQLRLAHAGQHLAHVVMQNL
ncbi:MAG: hypothetical protein QM760_02755 [Nibricoccus sp.]